MPTYKLNKAMTRTKRVLDKSRIFSISDKYNSHSETSRSYSVVFEWQRIIQYTSFFHSQNNSH